jgi:rhodanese-related sulfurtransferase
MSNLFHLLTGLLLSIFSIDCNSPAQGFKSIDAEAFDKAIQQSGVQVLDCRTAGEYRSGHLKGSLQADWTNKEQFADRTQHLDPTKPVYVYCLSGARSEAAGKYLLKNGFKDVSNLSGGINAWKRAGKQLEGQQQVPQMDMNQYQGILQSAEVVLIDFGAEWCPPCKKMEPLVNLLKKDYENKVLIQPVDGGVHTDVMNTLNVEALPTFILYKKGQEVWRKQGIVEDAEFRKILNAQL